MYIVTEKFDGMISAPTYDSVFVTNPSGVTSIQTIPHMNMNLKNHNSSLNIIFNSITNLGYKMMENGPMQLGFNTPSYYTHTWYFYHPWTTAGLIPAGVNNSLIKITNVFPNPTSNVVNLKFASSSNNSKLYLIHSGGYIINEYNVSNLTDFSVNTSLLSNGTYLFVLVSNGVYSESKSLLKQ